jgi:hypothetical protein
MKNYLTSLLVTFLSMYAIAVFIAWDFTTIASWPNVGRGAFLFFTIVFSIIYSTCKDADNK